MISKSYPYLSIAKKHAIDYSVVLAVADLAVHGRGDLFGEVRTVDQGVLDDVNKAAQYFRDVQAGIEPFPPT